jgi:hypothetical protein
MNFSENLRGVVSALFVLALGVLTPRAFSQIFPTPGNYSNGTEWLEVNSDSSSAYVRIYGGGAAGPLGIDRATGHLSAYLGQNYVNHFTYIPPNIFEAGGTWGTFPPGFRLYLGGVVPQSGVKVTINMSNGGCGDFPGPRVWSMTSSQGSSLGNVLDVGNTVTFEISPLVVGNFVRVTVAHVDGQSVQTVVDFIVPPEPNDSVFNVDLCNYVDRPRRQDVPDFETPDPPPPFTGPDGDNPIPGDEGPPDIAPDPGLETPETPPASGSVEDTLANLERLFRESKDDSNNSKAQGGRISPDVGNDPNGIPGRVLGAAPGFSEAVGKIADSNPNLSQSHPSGNAGVSVGSGSAWVVNLSALTGRSSSVDLNPLTNSRVGSYMSSVATWVRRLVYIIVSILGANWLFEHFFRELALLTAPKIRMMAGFRSKAGTAELATGVIGTIGAIGAGTVTFGAGTLAIGGLIGTFLASLLVPMLIHVAAFAACIAPALISLGTQGMMAYLSSGGDSSSVPGSSFDIWGHIQSIPAYIRTSLSIVDAFLGIAFLASYWISYLITKRVMSWYVAIVNSVVSAIGV